MPKMLAILLLCLGTAACEAQSKAIVIPFHDVNNRMMVDSKIDGHAVRLLIDTGAQVSLDLRQYRRIVPLIHGNSLEFERTHEEPFNVLMMQPTERFDGVIGIDTVQHFHTLRIDYRRHVIELGD